MNATIDRNIQKWLNRLAKDWNTTIEQVALLIDKDYQEIPNRERYYPKIAALLKSPEWQISQLAEIARKCYVLGDRFDGIRFNRFVNDGQQAEEAIHELVNEFPINEIEIVERINGFIATAVKIGYSTPEKTFDWAGAGCLASLFLSAMWPDRFVDFRQNRWAEFARLLGYPLLDVKATYGEKILWAGRFACEIVETDTFRDCWPDHQFPLWVVAGLCWYGPQPKKPAEEPVDESSLGFPEGNKKARLHRYHERNQTIVHRAKRLAFERDPFLRCEVCDFSFREVYGEAGINIIEAHHTVPVATLAAGSRTRVEDIALLCSNCHRMIHSDKEKTLSLSELSELLNVINH